MVRLEGGLQDFLKSMYRYLGVSPQDVEKVFGTIIVERRKGQGYRRLLAYCSTTFQSKPKDVLFWLLHKLEYSCLRDRQNEYRLRKEFVKGSNENIVAKLEDFGVELCNGYAIIFYPSRIKIKTREKERVISAPYSNIDVYIDIDKRKVSVVLSVCKECELLFRSIGDLFKD